MGILQEELLSSLPGIDEAVQIAFRLVTATVLAAIIGYERERTGKSAGLRTHMMVALGSALFVLAPIQTGMEVADLSRVAQGIAAGIGFIGAGAILKVTSEREIQGLTTASGIWMTAAVGLAAGMGRLGLAAMAVGLAWVILHILGRLEVRHPAEEK
jgi:putative Mg2+ transporter-C (MgtC) family protein